LAADGTLRCLRAANGKLLWKKNLLDDFEARQTSHRWATSPVVEGESLLINANTAEIALDKKTGKLQWSITDKPRAWGSFATTVVGDFLGTRCGVFLGPSTLNIVEVATGKKLWSYSHDEAWHPNSDPITFDNQVFIQLLYSCSLLESAGAEPRVLWRTTSFCNSSYPTPVLVAGYLFGTHWPQEYFLSTDDWASMRRIEMPFRCIEWKTGRVLWEKSMKNVTLTAANGKLLLLEVTGILHIAEAAPSSYQELCSADVLGGANKPRTFVTPPVLCNGRIYCRNFAGDLICIDVSN
jgi:outer membrane protein assembly factor BamB